MDAWFHPEGAPRSVWVRRRAVPVLVAVHALAALVLVGGFQWIGAAVQGGMAMMMAAALRPLADDARPGVAAALVVGEVICTIGMTALYGQAPVFFLMCLPLAAVAIHLLPEALALQAAMVGVCVTGFLLGELWPTRLVPAEEASNILLGALHMVHVTGAFALLYAATPAER